VLDHRELGRGVQPAPGRDQVVVRNGGRRHA
jgi:hypothetical protein